MAWFVRGRLARVQEDRPATPVEGESDEGIRRPVEEQTAECETCRAQGAAPVSAEGPRVTDARTLGNDVENSGASGDQVDDSGACGDEPSDTKELPPHSRIGRYVVERLIGHGAMGAVYLAIDPDLDRKVALKLLRDEILSYHERHEMRARLLREAQAMARLSHPEVITVFDVGAFGDQVFIAMEYVEGETLRRWRVARHRNYREVLAVYERAGSGLAAAHEANLVHRDFKPDNVLVGRDGRVRVTDFGVARSIDRSYIDGFESGVTNVADEGHRAVTLTRTGAVLGTPAYMAPEQLRGQPADARSDVFGFCVSLYEALYGERPFAGSSVPLLQSAIEAGAVRSAPVMTPVPLWLRSVLLRGLRASPDERFESMRALLDDVRAAHARAQLRTRGTLGAAAILVTTGLAAGVYLRGASRAENPKARESTPPPASALSTSEPQPSDIEPRPSEPSPPFSVVATASAGLASPRVPVIQARPRVPATRAASDPHPPPVPSSGTPTEAPPIGKNRAPILE